ncbi:MAG: hypothetical protein NKF70_13925 [Methanobacterium sp. ERen5]|nr:MAG: hypothetical protein NKF70_13925 [Methanobacterium sp. ERen5]
MKDETSIIFVNKAFNHSKTIGATNEGVEVLDLSNARDIVMEKSNTNEGVNSNYGVVTATKDFKNSDYATALIDAVSMHRHWDRELDGLL